MGRYKWTMSNRKNGMGMGAILCFITAGVSLIVVLLPLVKQLAAGGGVGGAWRGVHVVFLGVAVVFFVVGIAMRGKNQRAG